MADEEAQWIKQISFFLWAKGLDDYPVIQFTEYFGKNQFFMHDFVLEVICYIMPAPFSRDNWWNEIEHLCLLTLNGSEPESKLKYSELKKSVPLLYDLERIVVSGCNEG